MDRARAPLRVAFLFGGGEAWLGGVNYLWNLLYALGTQGEGRVRPVLVTAPDTALHGLDQLPGIELVTAPAFTASAIRRTLERRVLGTDAALAELCAAHRIELISHSGTFGWRFPVPAIPWIPDLQHRRLPAYFGLRERRLRDVVCVSQLLEARTTIVSSEAARNDLHRFYGPLGRRARVLHFVSQPRAALEQIPGLATLRERWSIPERYVFLPNQFWRHKNHRVVVDALALAKRRGDEVPTIVLTGKGEDYRAPDHYAKLIAEVERHGLRDAFVHLGTVPFEAVIALMHHSLAVLNPSFFEGWSTTVEEGRSLGKTLILSDIDVHREQAPPGAHYFSADDPAALLDRLMTVWASEPGDLERARRQDAAVQLEARTRAFARRYEALAVEAVGG